MSAQNRGTEKLMFDCMATENCVIDRFCILWFSLFFFIFCCFIAPFSLSSPSYIYLIFGGYSLFIRIDVFVYSPLLFFIQCNALVNQYGDAVIEMLISAIDPESVCKVGTAHTEYFNTIYNAISTATRSYLYDSSDTPIRLL